MNGRRIAAVAVLAAALVAGAATAATAAATSTKGAGVTLKPGPNHKGTLWSGQYVDGKGRVGYCVDYLLDLNDSALAPSTAARQFPGPEAAARGMKLVNTYGATKDNRTAMRVHMALLELIAANPAGMATADQRARAAKLRADMPTYRAQWTAADRATIVAMLTDSLSHGPYRATVTTPGAVPGKPGSATLTVLDSRGKPAKGLPVVWALTGGTTITAGKTTSTAGTAVLGYRATAFRQTITVTSTVPSSLRAYVAVPSSGRRQVLVGPGMADTVKASGTTTLCPVTLKVVKRCDCDRNGIRQVEFTFTADTHPGSYRAAVLIDGRPAATAPLATGRTVTLTVPVKDGADVEAIYMIDGTAVSVTLDSWTQRSVTTWVD